MRSLVSSPQCFKARRLILIIPTRVKIDTPPLGAQSNLKLCSVVLSIQLLSTDGSLIREPFNLFRDKLKERFVHSR